MIKLHEATMNDAARLYAWRMDPSTAEFSFHGPPTTFKGHCEWLEKKLAQRPQVRIWIAVDTERTATVGTVRLERHNDTEEISLIVDPRQRGRGYAYFLIQQGAAQRSVERVVARVKPHNYASLRAFWSLGFRGSDEDGVVNLEKSEWS